MFALDRSAPAMMNNVSSNALGLVKSGISGIIYICSEILRSLVVARLSLEVLMTCIICIVKLRLLSYLNYCCILRSFFCYSNNRNAVVIAISISFRANAIYLNSCKSLINILRKFQGILHFHVIF